MRISPDQTQSICKQIHRYRGDSAVIWLFGSRVFDDTKSGDVDLYVEAEAPPLLDELRCKIELEESLDVPVGLVIRQPFDSSPIARIARTQGRRL